MKIGFAAGQARSAPLTWGQRDIWRAIEAARPQDGYLNFGHVLPAPRRSGPVTLARAADALGKLVERHEALRTRISGDRQQVESSGQLDVTVTECAVDEVSVAAEQELNRMSAPAFHYAEQWPLRAGFVVTDGVVQRIVLVFCHMAVDGHGAEIVLKDLRLLLLRGTLPQASAAKPADLAAHQNSADGRKMTRDAVTYWTEQYGRITPASLPTAPVRQPRYVQASLYTKAAAAAAHVIADRDRVSSSTVFLTAVMKQAAELTGQRVLGMRMIVSNRFSHGRRDVVSTISQEGLVVLDLGSPDFDGLVRQAWQAALRGYRFAQFDPDEMHRVTSALPVASFGCFNDQRLVQRAEPLPPDDSSSTVQWTSTMDRNICDFRVHVGDGELSLAADTALLSPGGIEGYLRDVESLLVKAAV
ncbi:hypothetical protein JOF56_006207 [Kibdelosporangium banguiense]|uniref:Condensation domain-containing protein n=1 Tax=Kibdelosporangium banguiense TaxID=1365924 RepID=A0ABS4TN33_9PSEU|nr:condensation domain-containing protein [Kibdelosporangium banguiense]MBP2325822.1 hypothetical protein [Kibdelosporangium banguiense]